MSFDEPGKLRAVKGPRAIAAELRAAVQEKRDLFQLRADALESARDLEALADAMGFSQTASDPHMTAWMQLVGGIKPSAADDAAGFCEHDSVGGHCLVHDDPRRCSIRHHDDDCQDDCQSDACWIDALESCPTPNGCADKGECEHDAGWPPKLDRTSRFATSTGCQESRTLTAIPNWQGPIKPTGKQAER